MNKRDMKIIKDLERFRVMGRDDIADLYFSHLKNPINSANTVLKRLVRDNQIQASKSFNPFVYFPIQSTMKKNSTKIPHFLKLIDVYKQLKKYSSPQIFQIEPKFKKGLAEPDIFTVIKNTPFFIEVQRNVYSQNVMDKKIKRYEALYYSDEFKQFPFIIMISETKYVVDSDVLTIFQVKDIYEFMKNINGKKSVKQKPKEIKMKIG